MATRASAWNTRVLVTPACTSTGVAKVQSNCQRLSVNKVVIGLDVARSVGNQQKWDTFVKERSGGCGSIVGHPALPVVAFAPL